MLVMLLFLSACRGKEDYLEFSKGSAYSVLMERGNYSMFLEAVDRSGYRRLVDGAGLITMFVPGNEAFREYLYRHYGTDNLDAVGDSALEQIVGYHLIQFSYTPENFLAFSSTMSSDGISKGEGSCYRYKTYMKKPAFVHTDALSKRKVNIYSRETYMPVFSSRLFKYRGISDAAGDYLRFFPDSGFEQDKEDQILAGDAVVLEGGVETDNGYLYFVDKVLEPCNTIYEELEGDFGKDYTIVKKLFDRISCYTYDAAITRNYSADGDSLFLHYHWTAPSRAGEIPEIASEWTYHDEGGVAFERGLRYTNNCFFPKDEVLEPYLKEYFRDWGTYETEDFISVIPKNAIYHFLMSHIYGSRDIILPSELDMMPVTGGYGERFYVSSDEVDADFCSNGVIYGMSKVFEPAVFNHLTEPLFRSPDYTFYARAFNVKSMYQQTVDDNNRFTLFIQDDATLASLNYFSSESTTENGSYTFRKGNVMGDNGVSNLVMSQFVYGDVDFSNGDFLRYYVSKDDKTYFYVQNNVLYDATGAELTVKSSYDTRNGRVYSINNIMPARSGGFQKSSQNSSVKSWGDLMYNAGIVNASYGYNNGILKESMVFFPTNEAVEEGIAKGYIPTDPDTLRMYVLYHFVPLEKNRLGHFLLPGVGPDGMTLNGFAQHCVTSKEYLSGQDAAYMEIGWDPADPHRMYVHGADGSTAYSVESGIELRTNCAAYFIDSCFDYRKLFRK